MQQKPTDELNDILENMQPDQLDAYLRDNRKYMALGEKAFYYYFKDTLEAKRIKLKDVYTYAGVTESFGGKIIRMEKHTTDRDLIIRLCLAGHFSLIEINRALKLYGIASQATGALVQALLPMVPFAYIAGSMAGSMLASAGYAAGKELVLQVKGEGGFEAIVPSTISAGMDIGKGAVAALNISNVVSNIKEYAVSATNNGKVMINSVTKTK